MNNTIETKGLNGRLKRENIISQGILCRDRNFSQFAIVFLFILFVFTILQKCYSQQPGNNVSIVVEKGWNLISLPFEVDDARLTTLFPSATSPAYTYDHGYINHDTLLRGAGYWIKFAQGETIAVTGVCLCADSIPIKQGWNLIGGPQQPLPVTAIATTPPNSLNSNFYSYSATEGYKNATTLYPGKAYWVKASQPALMIEYAHHDSIDGDWTVPVRLMYDTTVSEDNPKILINGSKLFVTWGLTHFGGKTVYSTSTNNGCTWANSRLLLPQPGDEETFFGVSLASSGDWIYTTMIVPLPDGINYGIELVRSSDFGKTWFNKQTIMSNSYSYKVAAFANQVFINIQKDYDTSAILRSTDYGRTFTLLPSLPPRTRYEQYQIFRGFTAYASGLHGTAKINADTINAVGETYYFHSKDFGLTWDSLKVLSTVDQYVSSIFDLAAEGDSNVYVVWNEMKYGGFFTGSAVLRRSTNGGKTFEPELVLSSSNTELNCISVKDSIVCIAWESEFWDGGQYWIHIYATYSTNYGLTFTPYTRIENVFYSSQEPDVAVGNTIFVVGQAGARIFFTKFAHEFNLKSK